MLNYQRVNELKGQHLDPMGPMDVGISGPDMTWLHGYNSKATAATALEKAQQVEHQLGLVF